MVRWDKGVGIKEAARLTVCLQEHDVQGVDVDVQAAQKIDEFGEHLGLVVVHVQLGHPHDFRFPQLYAFGLENS